MPDIRVIHDDKEYIWNGNSWYGANDFITPPMVIISKLNILAGFNPTTNTYQPQKTRASSAPSVSKQDKQRGNKPFGVEDMKQLIEAVAPNTEPRLYRTNSIDDLESLAQENPGDMNLLMTIMFELRHRHTRRAKRLREGVLEQMVIGIDSFFPWPDTEAEGGDGSLNSGFFQWEKGLLKFMGYSVGQKSSLSKQKRRLLLDDIYLKELPKVNSPDYMLEWGRPHTCVRLRKMAESIASFVCNAKRRKASSMPVAVTDWEADLEYLRLKYYVGQCDFGWPTTDPMKLR